MQAVSLFLRKEMWWELEEVLTCASQLRRLASTYDTNTHIHTQINIFDVKLDIILQDFCHRRGRNNSALLQTEQRAESYALLHLEEYVQEINSRQLSVEDLPEPDWAPPQLRSSSTEAIKAQQMATVWEEL